MVLTVMNTAFGPMRRLRAYDTAYGAKSQSRFKNRRKRCETALPRVGGEGRRVCANERHFMTYGLLLLLFCQIPAAYFDACVLIFNRISDNITT